MAARNMIIYIALSQILLASLTALVVADFYESTSDFNVFNNAWNGYSRIYGYAANPLVATFGFPETIRGYVDRYNGNITIVLPVYMKYSEEDAEAIGYALRRGARIIVLAEHGAHTNELLEDLGLDIRVYGSGVLMDPVNNYRDPGIVYVFGAPTVFPNKTLVLNYATAIKNLGNASPWFYSSSLSYIDSDLSGGWDPGEPSGPFPVAAYVRLRGGGELILVADASLFLNEMLGLGNNTWFARYVIHKGRAVVFDQAHIGYSSRDYYKYLLASLYSAINPVILKTLLAAAYIYTAAASLRIAVGDDGRRG